MQYIPLIISAVSCLIAVLSFFRTNKKETEKEIENRVKIMTKLDQLCNTTNSISVDVKATNKEIQQLDKRVSALEIEVEHISGLVNSKEHNT